MPLRISHAAIVCVIALAVACGDDKDGPGVDLGTQEAPVTVAAEYQLVLQFQGDAPADYDEMIAIENMLIEKFGEDEVDGHDIGTGVTNIFIHTHDPLDRFERAKSVIAGSPGFVEMRAAYRNLDGETFTVIWPEDAEGDDFSY